MARIVTVSSDSHSGGKLNWSDPQLRRNYNGLQAYENTKLANILFTVELNKRLEGHPSIRAFAVDPGLVKTDIGYKGTPVVVRCIWKLRRSGGVPPEIPAQGIVYLLTETSIQDSTEVYWKNNQPIKPSRKALDPVNASRLWSLTADMCGMERRV